MDKVEVTFFIHCWDEYGDKGKEKQWVKEKKEGYIIESEVGKITAHQNEKGFWVVSEYKTGTKIGGPCGILEDAIDIGIFRAKQIGAVLFRQRIDERIEQHGIINK